MSVLGAGWGVGEGLGREPKGMAVEGAGARAWQGQQTLHTLSPSTFARAAGSLTFLSTHPVASLPGQTRCSPSLAHRAPYCRFPQGLQTSLSDRGLLSTLGADPFHPPPALYLRDIPGEAWVSGAPSARPRPSFLILALPVGAWILGYPGKGWVSGNH